MIVAMAFRDLIDAAHPACAFPALRLRFVSIDFRTHPAFAGDQTMVEADRRWKWREEDRAVLLDGCRKAIALWDASAASSRP